MRLLGLIDFSVLSYRYKTHPMNLIKVIPTEINFLNSKFKEEGCDSRQHLNLPLEDEQ